MQRTVAQQQELAAFPADCSAAYRNAGTFHAAPAETSGYSLLAGYVILYG